MRINKIIHDHPSNRFLLDRFAIGAPNQCNAIASRKAGSCLIPFCWIPCCAGSLEGGSFLSGAWETYKRRCRELDTRIAEWWRAGSSPPPSDEREKEEEEERRKQQDRKREEDAERQRREEMRKEERRKQEEERRKDAEERRKQEGERRREAEAERRKKQEPDVVAYSRLH